MQLIECFENIQLNNDQSEAINKIANFLDGNDSVFILKGYAGTGKTTLIKGIVTFLDKSGIQFNVCAPTGRAAKVLRDKTGYGQTIHSTIYDFENLEPINDESNDVAEHSFKFRFPIKKLEISNFIIIDEASMISSKKSEQELFSFGTDILLDDLLTYAQLGNAHFKSKLLIIGDPAQLPPVTDNNSLALEKVFFKEKNISVEEYTLTEIMRQKDGLILNNAMKIRDGIQQPISALKLSFDEYSYVNYNGQNLVDKYCSLYPQPDFSMGVIIAFSNTQTLAYNKAIRDKIFPNANHIIEGDILQVIANNYFTYGIRVYNGDFAKVIAVDSDIIKHSAPVYVYEAGEKKRKIILISFRKITFRLSNHDIDITGYINETLLNSTDRDLTIDQSKALYINAVMRFREAYPNVKLKSQQFKDFLRADEFFNALNVKYGYSITCHKAQGGEWDTVFVDYYGRVSLKKDPLKWCYTATTRAVKCVYAFNYPDFGKYYKLSFSTIGLIGQTPHDALCYDHVPVSPFHSIQADRCKRWLYWNIIEKSENTPLSILRVDSFPYSERYHFKFEEMEFNGDIYHDGAGYYKDGFSFQNLPEAKISMINDILSKPNNIHYNISYAPSSDLMNEMYSIIASSCEEWDFRLTNIVESLEKYFVTYYFQKNNILNYIQMYFNAQKQFTKAFIKTTGDINEPILIRLIETIQSHAA